MIDRAEILKRLRTQEGIEGPSEGITTLRSVAHLVRHGTEWDAMVKARHHSYGHRSYDVHVFYDPSPLLLELKDFFMNEQRKSNALERKDTDGSAAE